MDETKQQLKNNYEKIIKDSGLKVRDRYEHFKGDIYEIIDFAYDSETVSVNVIYQDIKTKLKWSRPVQEFISYKNGLKRFSKVFDSYDIIQRTLFTRLNNKTSLLLEQSSIIMDAISYLGVLPNFTLQSISPQSTYTFYLDNKNKKMKVGIKFSRTDINAYDIRVSACYRQYSNTVDKKEKCFSYEIYHSTTLLNIVQNKKLFSKLINQFYEIIEKAK